MTDQGKQVKKDPVDVLIGRIEDLEKRVKILESELRAKELETIGKKAVDAVLSEERIKEGGE